MLRTLISLVCVCLLLSSSSVWAQEPGSPTHTEGAEQSRDVDEPEEAESEPPAAEEPANITEARGRVELGERFYQQGNYDAALTEFRRAYDIMGDHPSRHVIMYNIGQCHEASFRYDEALEAYHEYLDEGGEGAEGRDEVEAHIAELEELLATVTVEVNVPEAEIYVNERLVGRAPDQVRVPGGINVFEVRAEGYVSQRREVQAASRTEATVTFTLEALPEEFEGIHQAYFWSSLGLTIATGIAAAIVGIQALAASTDVSNRLADDYESWSVGNADLDEISQLALATDLLIGATALLGVTSLVLGLLTRWQDEEEERQSSRPHLSLYANAGAFGFSIGGAL